MKYFLSTKYKLGKIEVMDGIIIHGGDSFKEDEGKILNIVMEKYDKQCNKNEIKQRRNTARLIEIKGEISGD